MPDHATDADAVASMELDDDALSSGLEALAAQFDQLAAHANAAFGAANATLARTGEMLHHLATPSGSAAAAASAAGAAAGHAGVSFMHLVHAVDAVATATKVSLVLFPSLMGKWSTQVRETATSIIKLTSGIDLISRSSQVLTGRLSLLGTAMVALDVKALTGSKAFAVLGAAGALATSKIIAGARLAVGAVAALGSSVAAATSRAVGGVMGGVGRSLSTASMFFAPMLGLALTLGPIGAAAAGVASGIGLLDKSISAAAGPQKLQAQFVPLLGSLDAAQARLAKLSAEADQFSFKRTDLAGASKTLEQFGAGALATGAGLKLVGDVAAATEKPINDLAQPIAQLYANLMNGAPADEAIKTLTGLGVVSAQTAQRLAELQGRGAKGGAVWAIAAADLMKFSGSMNRESQTWSGIMGHFSDNVGHIFEAIGAPLITALTPFMLRMNAWLQTLIPWAQKFGSIVSGWAALLAQTFADGKMIEALKLSLTLGFKEAVNFLTRALVGVGSGLIALLSSTTAWAGMGNALRAIFIGVLATLTEGIASTLDKLRGVKWIGGKAGQAADALHATAGSMFQGSDDAAAKSGAQISAALGQFNEAFSKAFAALPALLDTSKDRAALMDLLRSEWAAAKSAIESVAKQAEQGGLPSAPVKGSEDQHSGRARNEAAGLQRIAGGGGFALNGSDPMLKTANQHLRVSQEASGKLDRIHEVLKTRGIRGRPVFA